jgi:hypothetical protein
VSKNRCLNTLQIVAAPNSESRTWVIIQGEPIPKGTAPGDLLVIIPNEAVREAVVRALTGVELGIPKMKEQRDHQ